MKRWFSYFILSVAGVAWSQCFDRHFDYYENWRRPPEQVNRFLKRVVLVDAAKRGFGIIVGEQRGKIFILTPAHVTGPKQHHESVRIGFDPHNFIPASLEEVDQDLDLALVTTRLNTRLSLLDNCIPMEGTLRRGGDVWMIGRSQKLEVLPVPGVLFEDPNRKGLFSVSIPLGISGCSGAPLVGRQGLAGMTIKLDGVNSVRAISTDTLASAARDWQIPWSLKRCRGEGNQDGSWSSQQLLGNYNGELDRLLSQAYLRKRKADFNGADNILLRAHRFIADRQVSTARINGVIQELSKDWQTYNRSLSEMFEAFDNVLRQFQGGASTRQIVSCLNSINIKYYELLARMNLDQTVHSPWEDILRMYEEVEHRSTELRRKGFTREAEQSLDEVRASSSEVRSVLQEIASQFGRLGKKY